MSTRGHNTQVRPSGAQWATGRELSDLWRNLNVYSPDGTILVTPTANGIALQAAGISGSRILSAAKGATSWTVSLIGGLQAVPQLTGGGTTDDAGTLAIPFSDAAATPQISVGLFVWMNRYNGSRQVAATLICNAANATQTSAVAPGYVAATAGQMGLNIRSAFGTIAAVCMDSVLNPFIIPLGILDCETAGDFVLYDLGLRAYSVAWANTLGHTTRWTYDYSTPRMWMYPFVVGGLAYDNNGTQYVLGTLAAASLTDKYYYVDGTNHVSLSVAWGNGPFGNGQYPLFRVSTDANAIPLQFQEFFPRCFPLTPAP